MKFLFFNLLNEGGALFMYTLLFLLITCLFLLGKAFLKGDATGKLHKLLKSISLFALVFGFFGHLIGLIGALDDIAIATEISSEVLAAGIKIGLLAPTFGILVFLITRAGLIFLTLKEK